MLAEPLFLSDPVTAACALSGEEGFVWLDSAGADHAAARISYLCVWPVGKIVLHPEPEALGELRDWMAGFAGDLPLEGGAPFQGGAVGYLAYEFAASTVVRFVSRHKATGPAAEFAYYDTVIAFDHASGEAVIYSTGLSGRGAKPDEALAREKIARVKSLLAASVSPAEPVMPVWQAMTSVGDYCASVERVRDYIRAGDMYQANVAGLWRAPPLGRADAFAHYLDIRARTQAPFSAFAKFPSRMIASFSPERLVTLDAGRCVKAEPIKGTIRRNESEGEDALRRAALQASEKDRAENVMIVDLLRNDLSRVCEASSVEVTSLCRVETFSNLHHLVSTIGGELADGADGFDLLAAVFPGGSITGAPKLRAMEIIDELEPSARGIFCGSLGWIGQDGAMDFSILIRSLDLLPDETRFWAGAGITLLSEAQAEYNEIRLKAERITSSSPVAVETP